MDLRSIPPSEFLSGGTKEEQAWALANGCEKKEGEAPRKAAIKQGFGIAVGMVR